MGSERELALNLAGTDAVLRAVISTCLGQYRRCEARMLADADNEALHQTRVSLRRLRSALALFRPLTAPVPALEQGLRGLSGALGAVRDLDVLLARTPPGPLHDRLSGARDEAQAHASALLHAAPTRALLIDLSAWIGMHPPLPEAEARDFAAAQYDRWRRKVKKAGAALADGDDAARHRLRKRVKKLRHAAELLGGLFSASGRRARFMAALEPLQDALGALNDLVAAEAVLARIGSSREPGAAALIGHSKRPALLARAAKAHDRLLAAPRFWR